MVFIEDESVTKENRVLRFLTLIVAISVILLFQPLAGSAAQPEAPGPEVTLEGVSPDQVNSVLARLSDEQVRSLLISELQEQAAVQEAGARAEGGIYGVFVSWLKMMNSEAGDMDSRVDSILGKIGQFPHDLAQVAREVGGDKGE